MASRVDNLVPGSDVMACQSVRLARSVRYLPKFSLYSRSCRELHLLPVIQVLPRQLQNIPGALLPVRR